MFVRSLTTEPQCRWTSRRRGAIAGWVIVLFPVLLAALSLAVQAASFYHRRVELQNSADAAALAGLNALVPVDDTELFGAPAVPSTTRDAIFADARAVAHDYAGRNVFGGADPNLDTNPTNDPSGELVIGTINDPVETTPPGFVTDLTLNWSLYSPFVAGGAAFNTVDVAMQRQAFGALAPQDVFVRSRAFLDRDVVGFKVEGSSQTLAGPEPAIPVVPLALLTDYSTLLPGVANPLSWEFNIIGRNGLDVYKFDAAGNPIGPVLPPADGIPEMIVTITGLSTDNGHLTAIPNTNTVSQAISQITTGITASQLAAYDPINHQLTLANGPANEVSVTRLAPNPLGTDFTDLRNALVAIKGQRRVWMLNDNTLPLGTVHVVGFVAARVMDANVSTVISGGVPIPAVVVVLQPTMMLTSTAVTDYTRRNLGPRTVFGVNSIYNPYIARTRVLR
jgi:hypothetical protein